MSTHVVGVIYMYIYFELKKIYIYILPQNTYLHNNVGPVFFIMRKINNFRFLCFNLITLVSILFGEYFTCDMTSPSMPISLGV